MLTKSVNKVYLLSYNACERQGLPALPDFDGSIKVILLSEFHCIGFDVCLQSG